MKVPALVALVAVVALGISFYAGVRVGETHKLGGPAPESISAGNQRTFFEPGDRYQDIRTDSRFSADFHKLTSYAGRRNSDR
jgi:hypothetical protein